MSACNVEGRDPAPLVAAADRARLLSVCCVQFERRIERGRPAVAVRRIDRGTGARHSASRRRSASGTAGTAGRRGDDDRAIKHAYATFFDGKTPLSASRGSCCSTARSSRRPLLAQAKTPTGEGV